MAESLFLRSKQSSSVYLAQSVIRGTDKIIRFCILALKSKSIEGSNSPL